MNAAPLSTSVETAALQAIVTGLIDACRDSDYAFTLAARSVGEPMLRAELAQYSGQRQEFVAELHQAASSLGHDLEPHGGGHPHDVRLSRELRNAIANGDRAALLEACEQFDLIALDAYRSGMHLGLPHAVAGLLHSHYFALTRVQSRLQSLADVARGNSPIDNARR